MSFTNEMDNQLRERNREIVKRFFEVPHNSPEQLELYAPDCVWEQPFYRPGECGPLFPPEDQTPPPLPEGFEVPEFTPEWSFGPTTIWGTEDPNYFFAENEGSGLQLCGDNTLQPYQNHYFHTFELRDGKIIHYREIANPLNLMKAMKVPFQPLPKPEDTIGELIALYEQEHSSSDQE